MDLRPHAKTLVGGIRADDSLPVSCLSQERVNESTIPTCLEDVFEPGEPAGSSTTFTVRATTRSLSERGAYTEFKAT